MKKLIGLSILLVIVAVVWFFNIRLIAKIKSRKPKEILSSTTTMFSTDSLETAGFEFRPLKRDPFNVIIDTGPEEPEMPAFSLKGVVLRNDGALALMELPDGNVYPMKKGEKYLGVKIKEVTPKEVIVDFRGKKMTYSVWP